MKEELLNMTIQMYLNYQIFKNIDFRMLIMYSAGAIVKNLAPNVNLSYCMDLWTLGSKRQKNYCWTFFQ